MGFSKQVRLDISKDLVIELAYGILVKDLGTETCPRSHDNYRLSPPRVSDKFSLDADHNLQRNK